MLTTGSLLSKTILILKNSFVFDQYYDTTLPKPLQAYILRKYLEVNT